MKTVPYAAVMMVLAMAITTEASARGDGLRRAERLCSNIMLDDYGARSIVRVRASYRESNNRYDVRGVARRRGNDRDFSCQVRRGRVTKVTFNGWNRGGGRFDDNRGRGQGSQRRAAIRSCSAIMRSEYGAQDVFGIDYSWRRSNRRHDVRGTVERRGRQRQFSCQYKNGRVQKITFDGWGRDRDRRRRH
ncbi:MAG: hypothetical protein AAF830_13555 [Pseudomonadota bacterium]